VTTAKAERSNFKKLIEGVPSKIIIVDDANLDLLKGRSRDRGYVGTLGNMCLNCGGKGYIITKKKHLKKLDKISGLYAEDRIQRHKCKRCGGRGILEVVHP